jgi:hypothetical protein
MRWTKAVALEVLTKTGAGILDASIGMDEDLEHPVTIPSKDRLGVAVGVQGLVRRNRSRGRPKSTSSRGMLG